jgi:hypothetical protein
MRKLFSAMVLFLLGLCAVGLAFLIGRAKGANPGKDSLKVENLHDAAKDTAAEAKRLGEKLLKTKTEEEKKTKP